MRYLQEVIICCAPEDSVRATQLAGFLESNCPVKVSRGEGVIAPDSDLIDTVEYGLSAGVVLVLLSPDSVPKPWRREKWEPVFFDETSNIGAKLAFVLLRDCNFPPLFRRRAFFELSQDTRNGQRALKRWLLKRNPFFHLEIDLPAGPTTTEVNREFLEAMACSLSDQPGIEIDVSRDAALAFARAHQEDFEGVFWVDCGNRSRTGVLGDTAQRLGLKLSGTAEENRIALHEFCAGRRCLFIFEHLAPVDRELVRFQGKTSTMFIAPAAAPDPHSFEEMAALFAQWRQNPDACLAALGSAEAHLRRQQDWRAAISLGFSMSDLLRHNGRLAEADDILRFIKNTALGKDDSLVRRSEWEQCWILNDWGQASAPPDRVLQKQPTQLSLPLAGQAFSPNAS